MTSKVVLASIERRIIEEIDRQKKRYERQREMAADAPYWRRFDMTLTYIQGVIFGLEWVLNTMRDAG
ncbi:MAG: hypothetical protein ACE5GD_07565 [Candidatus Geothermarchaeales archaeon]